MKRYFIMIIALLALADSNAQVADSSKREVKLEGTINFRDIGGYKTTDGRHVKWGKIYRSAALNKLTDSDLEKMKRLRISIDADFRGPYEVSIAPDRIPAGTNRISLPAGSEDLGTPESMKKMLQAMNMDSVMVSFYTNTSILKDRYKPIFDELVRISPDSALLFHCSAGKDRTGIAAALVLYALGVPEQTILEDYLASNYYRKDAIQKDAEQMVKYFNINSQRAKEIAGVKKDYLMATYDAIVDQYGSLDIFLQKEIGLDQNKISKLKAKFLE